MGTNKLIVFRLHDRICALPLEVIREVLHMPALARPPGLPVLVEGLLCLGDRVVPVVRTARLFGLCPTEPGLYTPIILLRDSIAPAALLIDAVSGIISVRKEALLPVRDELVLHGCVMAEVHSAEGAIHVLSPTRLLLDEERKRLETLTADAESRLNDLLAVAAARA